MPSSVDTSPILAGRSRFFPWVVALALAAVVFPIEWLGVLYPQFGGWLNSTFPREVHHSIGHATLFTTLGVLALWLFPVLRVRPLRYSGLLMLVAVAQEGLQLAFKGRGLWFDDGRDLMIDFGGLLLAFALMWLWRYAREVNGERKYR